MVSRYTFLFVVLLVGSAIGLRAQEPVCTDNICTIEAHGSTMPAGEIFSVVSPLGQSLVRPIEQSPRLSTLDGKTIAIVGGSFMASVTHPELKRLILKEYPTAKVYVLSLIHI